MTGILRMFHAVLTFPVLWYVYLGVRNIYVANLVILHGPSSMIIPIIHGELYHSHNIFHCNIYRFPKEVEARRKWLSALQLNDLVNFECSSVCSAHFLPEEIVVTRSGRRHYLVEGSVPSRLPPNQRMNTVQVCMYIQYTETCAAMHAYPTGFISILFREYEVP
jgi:hypothetical protein